MLAAVAIEVVGEPFCDGAAEAVANGPEQSVRDEQHEEDEDDAEI